MNAFESSTVKELLRSRGAVFEDASAASPPLHYGDTGEEYRALTEGVGLVVRSWASRLEVAGADRVRFLNAMMTCDIPTLEQGEGTYGFFTDQKGKILADAVVLAGEERLVLELPAGKADEIRDHLVRYLVADRVELVVPDEQVLVDLAGPGAAALLEARAGGPPPAAPWEHRSLELAGVSLDLAANDRFGASSFSAWTDVAGLTALLGGPSGGTGAGDLRPVGYEAWETVRVERGAVRFGIDFGAGNLPQESGLDQAVSYTKGCYLGQEVVARLHYRGKAQRGPRGLLIAGSELPSAGETVRFEERDAGRLTSVVRSPARGGIFGLALLHRRAFEPGTRVELGGGAEAEVVVLSPGED